ncbi:hypothetical protein L4D08_05200 [Photobacterium chitinilyticum]|uniref:hypothetical protein n=1 Tax=Photobacterium chitinilyticum TaxID=2485123 RepID=UPI003D10403C
MRIMACGGIVSCTPYMQGMNNANRTLYWKPAVTAKKVGRHGMIIINEGNYDRHS